MKKRKSAIENYRERKVSSGWLTLNVSHLSLLGCWLFLVLRRSFHRVSCFRKKKRRNEYKKRNIFTSCVVSFLFGEELRVGEDFIGLTECLEMD